MNRLELFKRRINHFLTDLCDVNAKKSAIFSRSHHTNRLKNDLSWLNQLFYDKFNFTRIFLQWKQKIGDFLFPLQKNSGKIELIHHVKRFILKITTFTFGKKNMQADEQTTKKDYHFYLWQKEYNSRSTGEQDTTETGTGRRTIDRGKL